MTRVTVVTFFTKVVVDVVTELAKERVVSNVLNADVTVLKSEVIDRSIDMFRKWKMRRKNVFTVNHGKTKWQLASASQKNAYEQRLPI